MTDFAVIPLHRYVSIPMGQLGFDGTTFTRLSTDPDIYYTQSGIYESPLSSAASFPLNATKFSQEEATYWYYKIIGFEYDNVSIINPSSSFLSKAFVEVIAEGSTQTIGGLKQFLVLESSPPGTKNLYGITPVFAIVPQELSSFNFALYTDSNQFGFDLGAATLSVASEVVSYDSFGVSGDPAFTISRIKPKTTLIEPNGTEEEYEVDLRTGVRTLTRTFEGVTTVTEEENYDTNLSIRARSDITTYPVQTTAYFYDAYNKFSGYYASDSAFNATVQAENAKGGFQYEVTPTIFPTKISESLDFNGGRYYRAYDPFLTNPLSHKLVTIN